MTTIRLIVECVGWVVVSPLSVWFALVLVSELAAFLMRRLMRRQFPHIWRIGFAAYLKWDDSVPSGLLLVNGNNCEWKHIWVVLEN